MGATEPIGPKFSVRPYVTPGNVYGLIFFPANLFFTIYIKRKMFIIEIEDEVKGICITRIYIVLNKEKK